MARRSKYNFGGQIYHIAKEKLRKLERLEKLRLLRERRLLQKIAAIKSIARQMIREAIAVHNNASQSESVHPKIRFYATVLHLDALVNLLTDKHLISNKKRIKFNKFFESVSDMDAVKQLIPETGDEFERRLKDKKLIPVKS